MRASMFMLLVLCYASIAFSQQHSIIPQPSSVQFHNGQFKLSKETVIVVKDDEDLKAAHFLNEYLTEIYGLKLDVDKKEGKNYIRLNTRKFITAPQKEGYTLTVNGDGVAIEGDTYAGTFYGMQTLIQLLPVQKIQTFLIPFVTIQDSPRFTYRGLHLDVGRHFFPVSFIKKYIDYIALHKMNFFHWHLTEDQGWRLEIKKYPKLTEVGGYRNGTIIGRYPGTGNDNLKYGGFYTQEEAKEIVKYAADRHITVVPEIEMPGHSVAALTAYPWLGCPGTGPYEVKQTWGVFDDVYCAGKDSTFDFLKDVLDEVTAIFPSKYIHIGGDESPKANWKKCPLCQKRIKEEGLKDEHELQSYFIQRMEKYLNSKGRTIIGWDEILEGGLAPNAIVMSWRGEEGGIEAAKQGHQVIMTPGSHVYFDHAQTQNEDSVTIGGYTSVEKVYSYEPVPKELNAEQAKYVLGAQANMWTEYMKNTNKVEYMLFPRLSALSEVLWTDTTKKNWNSFERRLATQFDRYKLWGANYSNAYYDVKMKVAPAKNGVLLTLDGRKGEGKLMYAVTGKHFAKNYTSPVPITENAEVTALYYKNGAMLDSTSMRFYINKASGKQLTLNTQPSSYFPGNGAFTLVDGIVNEKGGRTSESVGFQQNVEAVINLATLQNISTVTVHALNSGGTYVYPPKAVRIATSTDGKNYKLAGSTTEPSIKDPKAVYTVNITPTTAKYVKVYIDYVATVPEGQRGTGEKTWMFLDEIQIQ